MRASTATTRLRLLAAEDAPFVRALSRDAFGEFDPHAARTTAHLLARPGARGWIAERGGEPVGFVITEPEPRNALAITAIAVARAARGSGVGGLLMRAAERHAVVRGSSRITLTTAQANLAALDLFLRCGFSITERRLVRYWRGQPACRLEKNLK
jgi:ribosomal protein S18 acetylase RimI-like enzyme